MEGEELEDKVYSIVDALSLDNGKANTIKACKLLSMIDQKINENHQALKEKIALHAPSAKAYLELYAMVILGDRLFELKGALKKALRVEERTQEAMKEKLKPRVLLRRRTKARKS